MCGGYNPYLMGYQGLMDCSEIPEFSYYHSMPHKNDNHTLVGIGAIGTGLAAAGGIIVHDLSKIKRNIKPRIEMCNAGKVGSRLNTVSAVTNILRKAEMKDLTHGTILGNLSGIAKSIGNFALKKSTLKCGAVIAVAALALKGISCLRRDKKEALANYNYPCMNLNPYPYDPFVNPCFGQLMDPYRYTRIGRMGF